jgi:toxin YhaV
MLVVDGWRIFAHPLFLGQIEKLTAAVTRAKAKALAALRELVFETIPSDPARAEYRQGGALAAGRKHWFRARFGGQRFRLFFRYNAAARIIIFAWANDAGVLVTG